MTSLPTMVITPAGASEVYARVAKETASNTASTSFGSAVSQAVDQAVQSGHSAEAQAIKTIGGEGNLTDVVTALSHAEMTLQTATAIRDRVVQAYQDIMKMPI